MTRGPAPAPGPGAARPRTGSVGVLADRIAAALVHHEPGWRLPRLTALARRYHVTTAEVDAALDQLVARRLLRRLPDGQVYRASPAEYRLPLEGIAGLASHVDPMGGELVCKDRQVSRRRPPEGVATSLGLAPGDPVFAVRCVWTVGGEPGAVSTSYLPERLGEALWEMVAPPFSAAAGWQALAEPDGQAGVAPPAGPDAGEDMAGQPGAVQLEVVAPPPSVARTLRLTAAEPVVAVTVRFEEPGTNAPLALTIATLRPDLFRIVVQAQARVPADTTERMGSVWTAGGSCWEP